MKDRKVRSPDEADALALTFALPQGALDGSINKRRSNVVNTLASSLQAELRAREKARN